MKKRVIELAKKIKALCDRGVGGEKENAETMLNDLLKKHNLTIDDIEGEKVEDYYFDLNFNDHELWFQIVKNVNYSIKCFGEFPKKLIKDLGIGGNYMIQCTASEFIEIEAKYLFFKRLYKEELDIFFMAFLKANDLLVTNPNAAVDDSEIDPDEFKRWLRIKELSDKITVGQFRKQLNNPPCTS